MAPENEAPENEQPETPVDVPEEAHLAETIEASTIGDENCANPADQTELLREILTTVQRNEISTAQWFEVVRGDLGVLYEHLDALIQHVATNLPSEPPAAPPTDNTVTMPSAPVAETTADRQTAVQPAMTPRKAEPAATETIAAQPASPPSPATTAPEVETPGFANRAFAAVAGSLDRGSAANTPDWEAIVFGPELAADPTLIEGRAEVVQGLQQQEPSAMALAGSLLEVRSAPSDRVPQLLKDVGEAYYRFRPGQGERPDPLRDTLIRWLEQKCDQIGSGNRIQLVRVGDRFDNTRHNAKARGVEVSDVYGWVVLRDNGKVYTKASVAVL